MFCSIKHSCENGFSHHRTHFLYRSPEEGNPVLNKLSPVEGCRQCVSPSGKVAGWTDLSIPVCLLVLLLVHLSREY